MSDKTIKVLGAIASIATIFATCIAVIALIPAFGQWLSPRAPLLSSAQTLHPIATPTLFSAGGNTALDLQLIFTGIEQGQGKSGKALIGKAGLSEIQDLPFLSHGGELSPNGLFIAYGNCGNPNFGIYLANADGSNSQMLVPLTGDYCFTAIRWSPDGKRLSYTDQQNGTIHVFNIADKSNTLIPNSDGGDWHWWSPTSDEIVYGKDIHNDTSIRLLYITDLNGNNRQLTFAKDFIPCERDINQVDTWAPAWSPNGDIIAFTQCASLFSISPSGKGLQQLTTSPYTSRSSPNGIKTSAYCPRWSPDGQWIIFIDYDNVLKRISADGSSIVEIGKLPYDGGPFSIAPNNK